VAHGAPALLFLASLMTFLAFLKVGQELEPAVMRTVYALERDGPRSLGLQHAQTAVMDASPGDLVNLLELSPTSFDQDFGRRSPTPRGCIAQAMDHLTQLLQSRQFPGGFPVVAIDIDITLDGSEMGQPPSGLAGSCIDNPMAINAALERLREHATVIALALERHDDAGRRARNAFIARTCSSGFEPGAPKSKGKRDGGVYYASAATFSRGTEPVYEAPTVLKKDKDKLMPRDDIRQVTNVAGVSLPPIFPSLGNLLGLARTSHKNGALVKGAVAALTSVCNAVKPQQQGRPSLPLNLDALLIDDVIFTDRTGGAVAAVLHRYDTTLLNFLRGDAQVRAQAVPRVADLKDVTLSSSTILLALTDGSTADRFVTPHDETEFAGGAWLQAVKSLSTADGLAKTAYGGKWLADLLAGVLFCVLITPMHWLMKHPWRHHPFTHRALVLGLPAVCAAIVIGVGFLLSAWLLPLGVWFNPLYMALGMAVHSYVDASARPSAPNASHHARASRAQAKKAADAAISPLVPFASTMSDWVDIEGAAPRRERSMPDRWLLGAWTAFYFAVVGCAVFVVLKEVGRAALDRAVGG
jgi:hypothetical protein